MEDGVPMVPAPVSSALSVSGNYSFGTQNDKTTRGGPLLRVPPQFTVNASYSLNPRRQVSGFHEPPIRDWEQLWSIVDVLNDGTFWHPQAAAPEKVANAGTGDSGWTTGALTHYFADKRELLQFTLATSLGWDLGRAVTTALLVAGPVRWRNVARRMGVEQVLTIDAQSRRVMTPSLARRSWADRPRRARRGRPRRPRGT